MFSNRINRPWLSVALLTGLFLLIAYSLYLMGYAAQKSDRFSDYYVWLLLFNIALLAVLAIAIIYRFAGIFRDLVTRAEGARLTWRLVMMFVFASLIPVILVWAFSVKFLTSGIDRWFDVNIEEALSDALVLSQHSLDAQMQSYRQKTERVAAQTTAFSDMMASLELNQHRQQMGAAELTLFGASHKIIATSSDAGAFSVPKFPGEHMLVQLSNYQSYVGLEPDADGSLNVRVVSRVPKVMSNTGQRLLSAQFQLPRHLSTLAQNVQNAYAEYKTHEFLRQPLKQSFRLTLSLVLLLSTLFALWAALFMARRLLEPIYELARATRSVADGDYKSRLPVVHHDELGFLVGSFNDMTQRIHQARDAAALSQDQLEGQRSYLQTVLGHLSSGVLTLDDQLHIRTANDAVNALLDMDQPLENFANTHLADVARSHTTLQAFYDQLLPEFLEAGKEWSKEVRLFSDFGRKILMCHGIPLPGSVDDAMGQAIVIDDITKMVKAQRDAAWSEVARRLAHEIKNPLTPIQLSAERMAHKLKNQLHPAEQKVLERSTQTIIKQVDAMKDMVNAFRDYASAPPASYASMDLNQLINEVADLYVGIRAEVKIERQLSTDLPNLFADVSRLRQVLHNLISNAIDAIGDHSGQIQIVTDYVETGATHCAELRVRDSGVGIAEDLLEQLFEPYVTSKPKGTGLGLAIVAKIIEEHGGMVSAANLAEGGAEITIRLPDKSIMDDTLKSV